MGEKFSFTVPSVERTPLENELRDCILRAGEIDEVIPLQLIYEFQKKLVEKYSDAEFRKFRLAHVLIMGAVPPEAVSGDFPGEDSIEAFIRDLPARVRTSLNQP